MSGARIKGLNEIIAKLEKLPDRIDSESALG
jgi:hypothetical protein